MFKRLEIRLLSALMRVSDQVAAEAMMAAGFAPVITNCAPFLRHLVRLNEQRIAEVRLHIDVLEAQILLAMDWSGARTALANICHGRETIRLMECQNAEWTAAVGPSGSVH